MNKTIKSFIANVSEFKPSAFFVLALISFTVWLLPDMLNFSLAVNASNFLLGVPSIQDFLSLITYQFAHANFQHLSGNFFFAAPFAIYAENRLGRSAFVNLWITAGIFSAIAFIVMMCATPHLLLAMLFGAPIKLVGASGSICGILTYACLSFNDKWWKKVLGWSGLALFIIPQFIMMGLATQNNMGVAFAGHVGGFIGALIWMTLQSQKKAK